MKYPTRWLAVLLSLHLALGLVYDWATPIFEAPDEGYHVAVARWIALGRGLPVQRVGEEADWQQEGSQPPLYHALVAGLTAWIDTTDWPSMFVWNPLSRIGVPGTTHNVNLYRHTSAEAFPYQGTALMVRLGRWFSLALSLATIVFTYWLALAVFPRRERLALGAAALVALNPKVIFINASVNNDNLLMLLSTVLLFVIVRLAQGQGRGPKARLGLGVLLGLAALTKLSGLVLWPLAVLGLGYAEWQAQASARPRPWRTYLSALMVNLSLVFGVALLVSGWWFVRNILLYGEWSGLATMVAIAGPRTAPITLGEVQGFFLSYWSVFGVFTILPPDWVHLFFEGLSGLALAGGLWGGLHLRRWPRFEEWLLALFCGATLVGVLNWTLQTPASQGRLLFGAVAPLSIFMAAGWLAPLARWPNGPGRARWADVGLGGLLLSLSLVAGLIPVMYIAPRYAPAWLTENDLPADLHPMRVVMGDRIELLGYTFEAAPHHPGEQQTVTLYWRALQPMREDYALALHLLGQGGAEIGKIDSWPGGGNAPTSTWAPGRVLADSYLIPIDAQAATPSMLRLNVAVWDGAPSNKLPMREASGRSLEMVEMRAGRVVPGLAPVFHPAIPQRVRFEYGLTLTGIEVTEAGQLTLYLQTDQIVPADFTLFAHLLDAAGRRVAQADGPPLDGDWPTSLWLPALAVRDVRSFALRSPLPAGWYTVRLGFYDAVSGARVAAFQPDGTEWLDDAAVFRDILEIK